MDTICSVCSDNTNSKTSCGHYICKECVENLRKLACPICRNENFESPFLTEDLKSRIDERFTNDIQNYNSEFPHSYDDSESDENFVQPENCFYYSDDYDSDDNMDDLLNAWYWSGIDEDRRKREEQERIEKEKQEAIRLENQKYYDWYEQECFFKTFLFDQDRMKTAPFEFLKDDHLNRFFLHIENKTFKELIEKFPLENVNLEISWRVGFDYPQSVYYENIGPNDIPAEETIKIDFGMIRCDETDKSLFKDASHSLANAVLHPIIYTRDFINILKVFIDDFRQEMIEDSHEDYYFMTKRQETREKRESKLIKC